MPSFADCCQRSTNPTAYMEFLDRFVRRVVGCKKFDRLCDTLELSKFVFVGDEAFALLVYENQEARWNKMYESGEEKIEMAAKFTDGGGGKALPREGRNRQGMGWDPEGIKEFNRLFESVRRDRESPAGRDLEERYRQHRENLKRQKRRKHSRKSYGANQVEQVMAHNEMALGIVFGSASDAALIGGSSDAQEDEFGNDVDGGQEGAGTV